MRTQEVLVAAATAALLGGVVVTILFLADVARAQTPAIAFLLGSIALAAGTPAIVHRVGRWGVPGDQD